MSASGRHPIRAFAIAPAVPPFLWFLASPDGAGHSQSAFMTAMYWGGMFAYAAALVLGVPTYVLANKYAQLRAPHILIGGGLIGAVVTAKVAPSIDLKTVLLGAGLGLTGGGAFWLLWRGRGAPPAPPVSAPPG